MTPRWPCILLAAYLALSSLRASAQLLPPPRYGTPTPGVPLHGPESYPGGEHIRATQARAREIELHQKMVSDSDRLVLLCKQLEENLKVHKVPNADDLRALQDIEKLARGVKDRMRQ